MPKTIEGDEDIEFAPIKCKADTLGSTLDDMTEDSNPNTSTTLGGMDRVVANKVWSAYLMVLDQFVELNWLQRIADRWDGGNDLRPFFPRGKAYQGLVCLTVSLTYKKYQKSSSELAKCIFAHTAQIEGKQFKQLLLDMYGDSFKDTDVFQHIKEEVVNLDHYTHLPEVHHFRTLDRKRIMTNSKTIANPFLLVYHVEPQYRPFIGGAILTAEENGEFTPNKYHEMVQITPRAHPKPSMKSIIQYAQKVDEHNVKQYLELLEQIPLIGERN
jgi:hypothetical protein